MKSAAYRLAASAFVCALFACTAGFSYIGLDDAAYTFRNPFVAGGLSFGNVVEAFTNLRHGGIWMPVTYVSYMLDASLCRLTGLPLVGEMHLVNVILHVVNFLLLWKFLCVLHRPAGDENQPSTPNSNNPTTKQSNNQTIQQPNNPTIQQSYNKPLSSTIFLFAALLWAIHPLRAEPVAWIAARKELLWTLFTLSGLLCWIKSLRLPTSDTQHPTSQSTTSNPYHLSPITYHLSPLLFCALACLSKPTAMCFPFLALLVSWRRGCLPLVHNGVKPSTQILKHSNTQTLPAILACFSIAAITAAIAAYSQTHVAGREVAALYAAPFAHRLVNALSAVGYYIRATFWPFGLHLDCRAVSGLWPLDAGWNFLALALFACALAISVVASRNSNNQTIKQSNILFASAWFVVSLLPTLGLFGSFGIEAHADRFVYFPSMAFSFLIVCICRNSQPSTPNSNNPTIKQSNNPKIKQSNNQTIQQSNNPTIRQSAFFLLILLSVVTFLQLSYWRDDAAAHRRALSCDPGHPRAMVHVADARCARQGDFDGGIRLYRQALARADAVPPGGFDVEDVKAKLAYALATRGRYGDFEEVKRLGEAVLQDMRLDRRGLMLDALGTAFLHDGDAGRAAQLFKASIDAPNRFWPKASTKRKLDSCLAR